MKLAAAQTMPKDGNIDANIADHYRLAEQAADEGVSLIVFPEMSLTGYARASAAELALDEKDERLAGLHQLSDEKGITIVAGAPINVSGKLHIGSFILQPGKETTIYTKQYLHSGEEQFFTPNVKMNPIISVKEERLSFAICADIANTVHPYNAARNKTTVYVTSLFYTPEDIAEGYEQLSKYAKQYSMGVLMANYGGPSNNFESGGQSAYWNANGTLVQSLEPNEEGLLIIEKERT